MMWKSQLDEALVDDGQVVTYKWLSRTARVPTNAAKQMLYSYKQAQKGLKAVYLVGGVVRRGDTTEHRFVVVPEDKLADAKSKFERITSEHIYSLQRSVPTDLPAALFQVDMPATIPLEERNMWGAIQCSKMKRRETVPEVAYADDGGSAPFGSSSHASAGSALPKASSKPAGKKIDAASFFGTKTQTKVTQSTKSTESKATEAASAKGAPPPKLSPSKPADGKKKLKRKTDDDDDDDDDNGASAMDVDEPSATAARTVQAATKTEPKKAEQKKEDTKATHKDAKDEKKEKKSDKDEKKAEMDASKASTDDSKAKKESKATTKKHKGSDDSGDGDAKASDADGGSPKKRKKAQADITVAPESPKKSISDALTSAGAQKKRTRTIVRKEQRTFMNDKGYMVTEMVEVEEEVEVDDEPPAPSPAKTKPAEAKQEGGKKSSVAPKQKQGSLLSFFTKK